MRSCSSYYFIFYDGISPDTLCLATDKITEGEFIQGVMDNKNILRLIQFDEPQKVQNRLKEKKQ